MRDQLARLAAYRQTQNGSDRRLLHVVVSPDQEKHWTVDAFWRARSSSYGAAEATGARGGLVIPHPYRSSERGDFLFKTAIEKGDWEAEYGKWSLFRNLADDWGEMDRFIEPGPHYHMLVPCEDFDPGAVPRGWVVKNIRSLSRFHLWDEESYRDMLRTSMYLLSHAAYQKGKNTVTWWGELHPNAFDPTEELSSGELRAIERMVERVIGGEIGETGTGMNRGTCSREGCEAVVVPIDRLREHLENQEWMESLELDQRFRLYGIWAWVIMGGDRPPPLAQSGEKCMLDWLEERGKVYFREHQVGLGRFSGGAPSLV